RIAAPHFELRFAREPDEARQRAGLRDVRQHHEAVIERDIQMPSAPSLQTLDISRENSNRSVCRARVIRSLKARHRRNSLASRDIENTSCSLDRQIVTRHLRKRTIATKSGHGT